MLKTDVSGGLHENNRSSNMFLKFDKCTYTWREIGALENSRYHHGFSTVNPADVCLERDCKKPTNIEIVKLVFILNCLETNLRNKCGVNRIVNTTERQLGRLQLDHCIGDVICNKLLQQSNATCGICSRSQINKIRSKIQCP